MHKIFKIKNWEVFLILFLIPFLIQLNLHFFFKNFGLTISFYLIWVLLISLWLYKLSLFCKSDYLETFEIKLFNISLLLFNLIFIISGIFILLLINEKITNDGYFPKLLSQNNEFLNICFWASFITVSIIASRFITAKKLQRKLIIEDYIKSAVSFLFLPIGIFWIQNEINKTTQIASDNKIITNVLIGSTFLLIVLLIINTNGQDLTLRFDTKNQLDKKNESWMNEQIQKDFEKMFNSLDDSSKAEYTFKSALQLYDLGNFRSAIESLDYTISLDSTNANYYFYRGMYLYDQFNQMDSAIGDMTKTIELNPNDWKAYYYRGFFNYSLDKLDKASQDVRKLIELDANNSNAYLLRGMLKIKLNDKKGACSDFENADKLGNEEAHTKIREFCS